jgi:hypothetical protein
MPPDASHCEKMKSHGGYAASLAAIVSAADNEHGMAAVHFTARIEQKTPAPVTGSTGRVPCDTLPLFRFGLRQVFLFFIGVSVLFAAVAASQGLTALVLMLAVVVVASHVFATALGNRLRARADHEQDFEAVERPLIGSIASPTERVARLAAIGSQPRSPWHSRGATALPWLRRFVIAAIALGGIAGAAYLAVTIGYRTSPAGILVGGLSVAVLCGWFTFLCGSFCGVFRHGFREALSEQQRDTLQQTPLGRRRRD